MEAVLGGTLEYAIIRRLTSEFDPGRLATTHPYYRSLQRSQPENAVSRAATILAVSEKTRLPRVDWASSMLGSAPPIESFGWEPFPGTAMWKPSWKRFAEHAFDANAFSRRSIMHLTAVEAVEGEDESQASLRDFAVHHIMRILLQLDAAKDGKARLFLPEQDESVLTELSAFAETLSQPSPVDLPDFSIIRNDPAGRSVTLLAFDPPDIASLIPTRNDKAVRKYAERVADLWSVPDPIEREREAVRAMREVVEGDQVRGWASRVFKAVGWGLKPLSWAGVPLVGAIADARDVAEIVAEREKVARNWLLIRTLMQDISLRDFLRRTDNL